MIKAVLYFLAAVFCLYMVLLLCMYLLQSRLVYFPEKEFVATPGEIGLDFEVVSFSARDGTELSGWLVPSPDARGIAILCNGNAGNISHRLLSIKIFHQLSLDVFIFDYRGYGNSKGRPNEQGTWLDAEGAWDYVVNQRSYDPARIVVFGESLGGSIAARLASQHRPAGLIVQSTFTSLPDVAAGIYPLFPVRLLSKYNYNTADYIQRVECPILVIHSRDDEIVPFSHGQTLYQLAGEPKEFFELRGDHNAGVLTSMETYTACLDRFIRSCIP